VQTGTDNVISNLKEDGMRMLSEYPEDFDRGIPNESLHHIE
jgi:hypothetical protein